VASTITSNYVVPGGPSGGEIWFDPATTANDPVQWTYSSIHEGINQQLNSMFNNPPGGIDHDNSGDNACFDGVTNVYGPGWATYIN
jgi:hypothetical protein